MKKLLLYIATVLFLGGCAQDFDLAEPLAVEPQQEVAASGTLTRSLDGAVYNEVIGGWMLKQPTPFAITNVKGETKLAPTHYALKIYPKNEEEQWRVETMKDVNVAYIPFGYVLTTQEETDRLSKARTRSTTFSSVEKSPYTVTHDYTDVTDGGPTGPVTYQLPILYAVWPADKPLPDDLEYVKDHDMFKPAVSSPRLTRAGAYAKPDLVRFVTYDDELGINVPLTNIKVRAYTYLYTQSGSQYVEMNTTTDSNGVVNVEQIFNECFQDITFTMPQLQIYFNLMYQDTNGRWKITRSAGTVPIQTSTSGVWVNVQLSPMLKTVSVLSSDYQENEIHRAVNYFFNGQNVFPKNTHSGGMTIRAHNGPYQNSPNTSGAFDPATRDIMVFNIGLSNSNVMGTTLHEIGHYIHHNARPAIFRNYDEIFVVESFAPYVGWYLGNTYYNKSLGSNTDITGQARQSWTKTSSHYSPLFIDLTDDYNQSTANANRPNDAIKNVPPSMIWNIISTSSNWAQCRSKIINTIGAPYCTPTQMSGWIPDFDYWIQNNY